MKVSSRSVIPPFYAMEVLKEANERAISGSNILHLEVGEPSTGAPRPVIEEAARALRSRHLGYSEALGLPQLRERLSRYYNETAGVSVPSSRILITVGSSGAFLLSFLAAFDVGDRVALALPGYPAYNNILSSLGIESVALSTGIDQRYQPTPELLEFEAKAGRIDGLLVASPANPTGTMLIGTNLELLVEYCRERGIRLISDEIYHGITYDQPAETVLALTDQAIVISSFSKYFCMTGWRLGWMVVPEELVRPIECLAQNLFISPSTLAQWAALKAFDCTDELDANVQRYNRNRELLMNELPPAGFDRLSPADGAFYIYADVRNLTTDSTAFCKKMLAEIGIAATPGVDFDAKRGVGYLRFCFAGSTEDIGEAARRLRTWLC